MNTSNGHSLAAERREKIRALVSERRALRVDEIVEALDVSGATVRRDLCELEQRGQVRRVHGGAVAIGGRLDEPPFDDKATIAAPEKQRIAEQALRMIEPGESVYLDGGSTVLALARLLVNMSALTVVTNSLHVMRVLSGRGPRLITVGGELRRRSQTFVGPLTEGTIERLHVDKAFMGTIGLSLEEGLTTTDPGEALTKQLVASHAGSVILLADSSKVGKVAFARVGDVDSVDALITDRAVSPGFVRRLKKMEVKLIQA